MKMLNDINEIDSNNFKTRSHPGRGRPKSAEKKRQILAAAAELFPQHHFDGVSMDMVAARAGVSKQTVYSHFRNKDQLYSETITCKCGEYGLAEKLFDDERPCQETLLDIARGFTRLILSDEAICMYRLSIGHAEQHSTIARLFYQGGPQATIDLVANYLRRQHQKGALKIADARQAAMQFLYMLQADAWMQAVLNVERNPQQDSVDSYVKSCVDLFMRAYGNEE